MDNFGNFIKRKRIEKGMSLRKLAENSGLSHSYIDNLEKGINPKSQKSIIPTETTLVKLARGLELPLGDVLAHYGYSKAMRKFAKHMNNDMDKSMFFEESFIMELIKEGIELTKHETSSLKKLISITLGEGQCDNRLNDSMSSCADITKIIPDAISVGKTMKVPVIGTIRCGDPIYAFEDIQEWVDVPISDLNGVDHFFLTVTGDSMIGSNIYPGYRVLVRCQDMVDNGQIAIVIIKDCEATLKRVKFLEEAVILYPDNPKYQPQIYKANEVKIIGKVVKVEFKPH